jgi:hypothetical protein
MKRSPEDLEKLIHQTLRALPDRRAPHSLESRVLTAINRQAALPWWRQSFLQWPMLVRCGFILVSGGLVKVALMAAVWVLAGFDGAQFTDAFATPYAWFQQAEAVFGGVTGFFTLLFRNIPPLWLYGGLAFLASLYAMLFGLGAAAYRSLYANR